MAKTYSMQFGSGDPRQYAGLSPTFLIFVNIATGATVAPPAITEAFTPTCGIYKFTWGTTTPIAFLADAATTSPGTAGRYVSGQIDPSDRSDEYGTTMVAIGTTLIGYGTSTVAFGSTLIGFGVSTVAFGSTLVGFGTSMTVQLTNEGSTLVGIGNTVSSMGTTLSGMGITLAGIGTSFGVIAAAIGTTASSFGTSSTDPGTLYGYLKRIQENLEGDSQYVKVSGLWTILDRASSVTLIQKTITNNATLVIKT